MTLGFVPGMIILVLLSAITTWTGLLVGDFRNRHPAIHSIGDAAFLVFGPVARELLGGLFWLQYTLAYGASALTVAAALNTFTDHSACTVGFVAVAAAISLAIGVPTRTLKWMSWWGYVALASIFLGVWVTAIACLAQSRPAAAPQDLPVVDKDIRKFAMPSLGAAMTAVSTQMFALGATAAFFSIHAEMKNPHHFNRSLYLGQGFVVLNYIVVSAIIYGKVGQYIASPALGSAGHTVKIVAYAISIPGLLFSCFFQAHLAAKYTFVRILRKTKHLQQNTAIHWGVWVGSLMFSLIFGFVVAGAVPFFDDLLGLIGAVIIPWFAMIVPACLALYTIVETSGERGTSMGKGSWLLSTFGAAWRQGSKTTIVAAFAWLCAVSGLFVFVAGTYGSIKSIADSYASGDIGSAFSCADNQ